ncbi:MAG: hypothetical protein AAFR73_05660 [Pseudomonadota bacterium]
MSDLPALTIILGPQTRSSLALNAHLRENRQHFAGQGMVALPSRLASPMMRRAIDSRPLEERLAEFRAATGKGPAVLSAINMFGPPQAGLAKGELFPDAELSLAGLEPIVGSARVVLAMDPMPDFFLAAQSEALEQRVQQTPWEVLYELSWYELVAELVEFLPDASFLVLTGKSVMQDTRRLEATIFGAHVENAPHPYTLIRHMISETGVAVLRRMLANGAPDDATLAELQTSFAVGATAQELRDRLGIDKVTGILLAQRFEEDIARISELPRVQVF